MGSQTTTQTVSIPGAGGQEQQLRDLLTRIAEDTEGQFGDLSQLAQGILGGPTAGERELVGQAQQASGDIARSQALAGMRDVQGQVEGGLLARGLEGSSVEAVNQALIGQDFSRQLTEFDMAQSAQSAQQLINLPFQRAGVQLDANAALMQRLTGAANPVMQGNLMERLAQTTTETEQPFDWASAMQGASGMATGIGSLRNPSGGTTT